MSCPSCNIEVNSYRQYRLHITQCHSGDTMNNVKCPVCPKRYTGWHSLYVHCQRKHYNAPASQNPDANDSLLNCSDTSLQDAELNLTPLEPDCPPSEFAVSLRELVATYLGDNSLTRSSSFRFMRDINFLIVDRVIPAFKNSDDILKTCDLLTRDLAPFRSEHCVLRDFVANCTYIPPLPYVVGSRNDFKGRGTSRVYTSVDCLAHRIPMRELFRRFFSISNLLTSTLKYMASLTDATSITNFVQGSFWKAGLGPDGITRNGRITIPFILYYDDFTTGNVLGPQAVVHKLGGIYVSFPSLAVNDGTFVSSSSLNKILLLGLFHSSDRTQFGNRPIFAPIIEEMNDLYKLGISFDLPDFKGTVYFQLAFLAGDNLGLNSILGFVESFSARRCCRICRILKDDLKKIVYEDSTLLRNADNYFQDVAEGDVSSGVKEKSVWFDLEGFDVLGQMGVDCMHDVFEGVGKYILGFVLKSLIKDGLLSLDTLNNRLHSFDFGPDNSAKPVAMTLEHIRRESIKQTASGTANLIRYLGVLIGHLVPEGHVVWSLYQVLHQLVSLVMDPYADKNSAECLRIAVEELNNLYLELTPATVDLKPKFHFLVHYASVLKRFGPLCRLSSMRFEGKHRVFKTASNVNSNRINLTLTLAKKHQLMLNKLLVTNKFSDPFQVKLSPKKLTSSIWKNIAHFLVHTGISKDELKIIKYFTYHQHYYSTGTTVVTHNCPNHCDQPQFLTIDMIFSTKENEIFLYGTPYECWYFDYHYCAYPVDPAFNCEKAMIRYNELFLPEPCTFVNIPNVDCFVVSRTTL